MRGSLSSKYNSLSLSFVFSRAVITQGIERDEEKCHNVRHQAVRMHIYQLTQSIPTLTSGNACQRHPVFNYYRRDPEGDLTITAPLAAPYHPSN